MWKKLTIPSVALIVIGIAFSYKTAVHKRQLKYDGVVFEDISMEDKEPRMADLDDALNQIVGHFERMGRTINVVADRTLVVEELQVKGHELPFMLPDEVLSLYGWKSAQWKKLPADAELTPGMYMLSFNEAMDKYKELNAMAANIAQEADIDSSVIWNADWFPLLMDDNGDSFYIVSCGNEYAVSPPIFYVLLEGETYMAFDNLTTMMTTVAAAFDTGVYSIDDDGALVEEPVKLAELIAKYNPRRQEALLGDAKHASALIPLLRHDDYKVRAKALQSLMLLKDKKTLEPLIDMLNDEDSDVRVSAIRIIEELRDARATEALIKLLKDEHSFVRMTAVSALGKIGDRRAVEHLISINDADEQTRRHVVVALGKLGDLRGVDVLIKELGDESFYYRSTAAASLTDIGDKRAVEPLIRSLKDGLVDVRYTAAYGLGVLGDERAIGPLSELLSKDNNPTVQRNAKEALERIRKKSKEGI